MISFLNFQIGPLQTPFRLNFCFIRSIMVLPLNRKEAHSMTEQEEFIYLWKRHPELHELILRLLKEKAPAPGPTAPPDQTARRLP